jgi:hypothetical protein
MPLAKGKSNKTVSKNIQTLVDDYQKSGRIGTSKPANKKAAVKQATAIALQKAGRSKNYAEGGTVSTTSTRTSRTAQPSSSGTSEKAPEYLPLPNQSAPAEDLMPKYKQTVPRMQWTRDPSSYGETSNRAASTRHLLSGNQPRNETERTLARELGMAFKKGGKVSAKKRRA